MSKVKVKRIDGTDVLIEVLLDIQQFENNDEEHLEFTYKVIPSKMPEVYYIKFVFND